MFGVGRLFLRVRRRLRSNDPRRNPQLFFCWTNFQQRFSSNDFDRYSRRCIHLPLKCTDCGIPKCSSSGSKNLSGPRTYRLKHALQQ